jgi:hypothetical protein
VICFFFCFPFPFPLFYFIRSLGATCNGAWGMAHTFIHTLYSFFINVCVFSPDDDHLMQSCEYENVD